MNRGTPLVCALVFIGHVFRGRLRFSDRLTDRGFTFKNGRVYRVFRHMCLNGRTPSKSEAPAVLVVRFKFARFSQVVNQYLSLIPIPFIAGYPGFLDKIWMVDRESGEWQGVYQWDSIEAARRYRESFVLKMMTNRAAEGTVTHTFFPNTGFSEFINRQL